MSDGVIIVAADLGGKIRVYENNSMLDSWFHAASKPSSLLNS